MSTIGIYTPITGPVHIHDIDHYYDVKFLFQPSPIVGKDEVASKTS